MTEPGIPDDLSAQIEITPAEFDVVDNSARKDLLLADRSITRLGERDPRYRETVFLEEAFEAMVQHGMSNRDIELGGIMLGFNQGDQTIVTRYLPLEFSRGTGGSLRITDDDWANANIVMDRANEENGINDEIISWFHTHPHDYPPSPLTTDDRFIMKNYFPGSDQGSPNDKTTFIMTTYSNNPAEVMAAWKWDEPNDRAVLMHGVAIAQKQTRDIGTHYFNPSSESARTVGREEQEISLTHDEIAGMGEKVEDDRDEITITEEPEQQEITIELKDEQRAEVVLRIKDLAPEPELVKLSIDEITPEYAKAMVYQINKNPDSPKANFLRDLLRIAKNVMPKNIVEEIDLVLVQTKSTADQITIIDEK